MRIRTIKPEWMTDDRLIRSGSLGRVLSIALICMADDHGRGQVSIFTPARVFPLSSGDFHEAFARLIPWYVRAYEVGGQFYYEIRNWSKHQRVSHPGKRNQCPAPVDGVYLDGWRREYLDPGGSGKLSGDSPETLRSDPYLDPDLDLDRDARARAGEPPADRAQLRGLPASLREATSSLWRLLEAAATSPAPGADPRALRAVPLEPADRTACEGAARWLWQAVEGDPERFARVSAELVERWRRDPWTVKHRPGRVCGSFEKILGKLYEASADAPPVVEVPERPRLLTLNEQGEIQAEATDEAWRAYLAEHGAEPTGAALEAVEQVGLRAARRAQKRRRAQIDAWSAKYGDRRFA